MTNEEIVVNSKTVLSNGSDELGLNSGVLVDFLGKGISESSMKARKKSHRRAKLIYEILNRRVSKLEFSESRILVFETAEMQSLWC